MPGSIALSPFYPSCKDGIPPRDYGKCLSIILKTSSPIDFSELVFA